MDQGMAVSEQDPFAFAADAFENVAIPVIEFYDDPVGFVTEFIDFGTPAEGTEAGLTEYQQEIMDDLPKHGRMAVRGPHGLGKTTTNALTVIWFAITSEAAKKDWKCATTAGAWRQLEHYLWPEIKKWSRKIRWDKLGMTPWRDGQDLLALSLNLKYGSAFAVASSDEKKIEGVHADRVLYIFDESKAIRPAVFDAAEGAFSGAMGSTGERPTTPPEKRGLEALAVATSTPGEPNGRFYDIHVRKPGFEDWKVRHVKVSEVMACGRISEDWRAARERQWGPDSALYANRVLGEFHASADDAVIPLSWIEAAVERWHEWKRTGGRKQATTLVHGVDVARGGADLTAIARRRGSVIEKIDKLNTASTTAVVAAIQVRMKPGDQAVIDVVGVGGGVFDQARERGLNVRPFTASKKSWKKDRSTQLGFHNRRAEMWWGMRELLDPAFDPDVCLPPDDDMIGELAAPHWDITPSSKIKVESKDDIKERLGRSTDTADAVLSTWTSPESASDTRTTTEAQHLLETYRFHQTAELENYEPGVGGPGAIAFGAGESASFHQWSQEF